MLTKQKVELDQMKQEAEEAGKAARQKRRAGGTGTGTGTGTGAGAGAGTTAA